MMGDQVEELIQEIAVKHGIAVSRDDPILILQTLNNRLIQESSAAQQAQLKQYKAELEAIMLNWNADAKSYAERILNASLKAGKEINGIKESTEVTAQALSAEIKLALTQVSSQICDAQRISMWNIAASCITLLASGLALWSVFR